VQQIISDQNPDDNSTKIYGSRESRIPLQDTIRFGEGQLIFGSKYKSEKVKKQQITAFKSK
jgi:hypothetical protein